MALSRRLAFCEFPPERGQRKYMRMDYLREMDAVVGAAEFAGVAAEAVKAG